MYKDALKSGFYNLQAARDSYRDAVALEGGMHADLVIEFIRVQALLMAPIAPHMAEHLWSTILKEPISIQLAQFPVMTAPVDRIVIESAEYVRDTLKDIRDTGITHQKKKKKGRVAAYDPSKPTAVRVFISKTYPEWANKTTEIVRASWTAEAGVDDAKVRQLMLEAGLLKEKKTMPLVVAIKVRYLVSLPSADSPTDFSFFHQQKQLTLVSPEVAFGRGTPFDEAEMLAKALPYLRRSLEIEDIEIVAIADVVKEGPAYDSAIADAAEPGKPGVHFYNPVA